MITLAQVDGSVDIGTLLDTSTDCLRFVTEFFEVISQSGPHIYHSALLLTPPSSIIRKLYGHQICSPAARVATGVPALWDSCTASVGVTTEYCHPVWSPCGQFVAVASVGGVEVRDSNTLERVSVLNSPGNRRGTPKSLAFSPDGHLLACSYL